MTSNSWPDFALLEATSQTFLFIYLLLLSMFFPFWVILKAIKTTKYVHVMTRYYPESINQESQSLPFKRIFDNSI
jgi:hypothetical protein